MAVTKLSLASFISYYAAYKASPEASCRKKCARIIIESALYICYTRAKRFTRFGYDYDELVNEGVLGLYRALDQFDLSKCVEFQTYAYRWVWEYMSTFVSKVKQKKTKNLLSITPDNEDCSGFEIPSNEKEPVEVLIDMEEIRLFKDKIAKLPEKTRKIVEMRAAGCTLEEIGKEVNLSRERVRQKLLSFIK